MADADPLVTALGNGLECGRNGGSGIRAAIALPALMGRLNATSGIVLGAGNSLSKTLAKLQRPDLVPAGTRTLNIMNIAGILPRTTLRRRCAHSSSLAVACKHLFRKEVRQTNSESEQKLMVFKWLRQPNEQYGHPTGRRPPKLP